MLGELKELFTRLAEASNNPVDVIWDYFQELWSKGAERVTEGTWSVKEYYEKCGREVSLGERRLEKIFFEMYYYLLKEAKKEPKLRTLFPQKIPTAVIMDSMSLRESMLLAKEVEKIGYSVDKLTYDISSAPSDTDFYREKGFGVKGLNELRHRKDFKTITILREGDLEVLGRVVNPTLIWSGFPDTLFEAGALSYDSVYEKTRQVFTTILERTRAEVLIVTSDHGYLAETERWSLPDEHSRFLERNFKAERYALRTTLKPEVLDWLESLPEEISYFVLDEKYVYVRGGYMWTTRGKPPASFHGGVSPMEIFVPFMILRRGA